MTVISINSLTSGPVCALVFKCNISLPDRAFTPPTHSVALSDSLPYLTLAAAQIAFTGEQMRLIYYLKRVLVKAHSDVIKHALGDAAGDIIDNFFCLYTL